MNVNINDRVMLKSGGPVMTVRALDKQQAYCLWQDVGNQTQYGWFLLSALKPLPTVEEIVAKVKDRTGYADLGDFDEDTRIDAIGRMVTEQKKTVAVVIDNEIEKSQRYIKKLTDKFPGLTVLDQTLGPVAGTMTIRVGPK